MITDPQFLVRKKINANFAGWIPTVTGRLSYRHVGDTQYPTVADYANFIANERRYILIAQRRDLSDALIPSLARLTYGLSGAFWFCFCGVSSEAPSDDLAHINGYVCIFKSKKDWEKASAGFLNAVSKIHALQNTLVFDQGDNLVAQFTYAKTFLSAADIKIDCILCRDGEVYFSNPDFLNSNLEENSVNFSRYDGINIQKWIADQAFFFLKDTIHTHQHHNPQSDTILVLQDVEDAYEWHKFILYSLYYHIVSLRRSRRPGSILQAQGFLAYIKSFSGICVSKGRHIPVFQVDALNESLASAMQFSLRREQIKQSAKTTHLSTAAVIMSALAIIAAIISMLVQPYITNKAKKADLIAEYLYPHIDYIILFFISAILLNIFYIIFDIYALRLGIFRGIMRVMLFARRISIVILFILCCIVVACGFVFIHRAII